MAIKILGGLCRGYGLSLSHLSQVRPTSVLLRRKLFDSKQDLSGKSFIDCCAGSGAMGLEAWSRGADRVFLIESDKNVHLQLEKNLQKWRERWEEELVQRPIISVFMTVEKWIEQFCNRSIHLHFPYDGNTIIYIDPPYEQHKVYYKALLDLSAINFFHGQIWVESDHIKGPDINKLWSEIALNHGISRGEIIKVFRQGTSYVTMIAFGD